MLMPRRLTGLTLPLLAAGWCALTLAALPGRAQSPAGATSNSPAMKSPWNTGDTNTWNLGTNLTPETVLEFADTNFAVPKGEPLVAGFNTRLAMAGFLTKMRQPEKAEPVLISLLAEGVPDSIQQSALFELAATVRMENDLPRAEAICSQFLDRWPHDARAPEVLLRQGQIFRQMGLNDMALTKFYAVMTAALSLKNDRLDYYQRLVLQAQMEIAETHYLSGQFGDAADFYSRILTQSDPSLDREEVQFRLIHSLWSVERNQEAASQAQDFLARYPASADQPEVRFQLAEALKQMGRNSEALQQVLLLLQEEKSNTQNHPDLWAYWQQRAGNEIANQLYREGDFVKALDIYLSLARLDTTPAWQVPVDYQVGITYERLLQPQKAIETYHNILSRETEAGTNATPGLKAVFDMARWRANFLEWQNTAEVLNRSVTDPSLTTNSLQ